MRTKIRELAELIDSNGGLNIGQEVVAVSKVAKKLNRWHDMVKKSQDTIDHKAFIE